MLVWCGKWRRLQGLGLYIATLIYVDGIARPAFLHYFPADSRQYGSYYWLTDVVLALCTFLLICAFFRRACTQEEEMWRFARTLLAFVFIVVVGISVLLIARNYNELFTSFIIVFSQNLYFTCLVLNTLLYVMIQQFAIDDDELGLLVCGIGVQFAGEAACFALLNLTSLGRSARGMASFLGPVCTLGMLVIWIYAVSKTPQEVPARLEPGRGAKLAEAIADS